MFLIALFSNFKVELHLQLNHFCLKVRIASLVAQSSVCRLLYRRKLRFRALNFTIFGPREPDRPQTVTRGIELAMLFEVSCFLIFKLAPFV